MFIDKVENLGIYCTMDNMKRALEFIKGYDFSYDSLGVHKLENEKFYYVVLEYETKEFESGFFEAHKKYIDIQYMLSGEERIYYNHINELTIDEEHNEETDFVKLSGEENGYVTIKDGYLAVFYPEDGHMPGIKSHHVKMVKKIVIKVEV